ncbi:MAG: acyl-CoA synthetase [Actinomycetota bacterium]|nr:acyl-CoA synthetase [Actinomycetota bacterium]
MHPGIHAQTTPDKTAAILAGSGERITYAELDAQSNQLAHLLYAAGLREGDHVSIFMENRLEYFVCYWAAIRSGLYFTTINRYLQPDESAYILEDSASRALFVSATMSDLVVDLPSLAPMCDIFLSVGGGIDGFDDFHSAVASFPTDRLDSQPAGQLMLYSSGTTGRPKGISRPLTGTQIDDPANMNAVARLGQALFNTDADTVYLSPAPIYHSAPLGFTTAIQSLGGTIVMMEKFDASLALSYIDSYSITHSQWVPTMFSRMLKLPPEHLEGHDWSSHQVAIHAAAPCPVEVKKQMFELWGPIIYEYYGGTELNGFVFCGPDEWLTHPGTVGRSVLGMMHICDDEGAELPNGEPGIVYFERDEMPFKYHNSPQKTKDAQHPSYPNWSALGDIGYLDDEGYLYLTDRKAFMIISGGVNIYPQEIEDCIIMHPKVADVAVFGVPNEDMGEEVKAVVQPASGVAHSDELARELTAYANEHIAVYKVPRSIDFTDELPRLPTGKLYKRILRDAYWGKQDSKIV